MKSLLAKAPEALRSIARGLIPFENHSGQGFAEFSPADLTTYYYGEGIPGVSPGKHPLWRSWR